MELSLAQASLVEENMGLIGFVLKKINASYVRSIPSVDYEDLYQFGAVGLCQAAQKFDKDRGVQFSTYAVYCIRNTIILELEKLHSRGFCSCEEEPEEKEPFTESSFDEVEEKLNFNQTLDFLLETSYNKHNIETQRAILELMIMGYSIADAAKLLGIPYKRAKALVDNIKRCVLKKNRSLFS